MTKNQSTPDRQNNQIGGLQWSRRTLLKRTSAMGATVVLGGTAATLLGACGSDDSTTASADLTPQEIETASGTIKMYGWVFLQADDEQNSGPVKANWSYITASTEIPGKVRSSGIADVFNSNTLIMNQLDATERLVPIDPNLIPNYETIAEPLRDNDVWRAENGDLLGVPFSNGPTMVAWSSEVPEPKSGDELLSRSEYRNGIGLADDATIVIPHIARIAGIKEDDPAQLTQEQLDDVVAFLDQLKPQVKTIYTLGDDANLLARGDIVMALNTYPFILSAGIPGLKTSLLGSFSFFDGLSILDGASLPAAYQWINRAISVPAQRAMGVAAGTVPVVQAATNVVPKQLPRSLDQLSEESPILTSPPLEETDGVVPLDDWVTAWTDYKASFA